MGHGGCIASDMITVDGMKVGYMYREEPHYDTDSGWVFLAGIESQDYMDEPSNHAIYDVNTIANCDPEILPFLNAPAGSAFARDPGTGEFLEESFQPLDAQIDPPDEAVLAKIGMSHQQCNQCGARMESGEAVFRSKTDTDIAGIVASHRSVHLALCPACAEKYDGTGNTMLWCMLAFVGIVVLIGLFSWVLPLVFR